MTGSYRGRRYPTGKIKFPPIAWVGVCIAAAVITTVIIGNLLKKNLDPDVLDRLSGKTTETEEPLSRNPYRKSIRAEAFSFGESVSSVRDKEEISVLLNQKSGKTNYRSAVSEKFGLCENSSEDLAETMGSLCATVTYVSGVYYPTAFSTENSDLFFAQTAMDTALLREFLRSGGSDVLLCDLPSSPTELEDVKIYLDSILNISGNAPIGVALTPDVITGINGGITLETLSSASDFLALDLRNIPTDQLDATVENFRYYIDSYDMRLLVPVPVDLLDFQVVK